MKTYRFVLRLLGLPLALHVAWLALRHGDGRYLRQRLGVGLPRRPGALWFHAVSVGEVNAIAPLVRALREQHPRWDIVVSTGTMTGGARVAALFGETVTHFYLPIDWRHAMARLLRRLQARHLYLVETELWPNLIDLCYRRGLPVSILNGRLSARTTEAAGWLRAAYAHALAQLEHVHARSEEDARRFLRLGTPADRVSVVGNIKLVRDDEAAAASQQGAGEGVVPTTRPYVLAASTREDEEGLIVRAWRAAAGDPLLVIAPRHPQRLAAILRELAPLGLDIAVRSRGEAISADTDIYLADTLGEMRGLMAGAEFVIMGGSFVPRGGQNILEAAQGGKAVIFGPHMDNFEDEARLLLAHEAAWQCAPDRLAGAIERLLGEPARCRAMGERGRAAVAAQQHLLADYLRIVTTNSI